jgi:hypothetical protein
VLGVCGWLLGGFDRLCVSAAGLGSRILGGPTSQAWAGLGAFAGALCGDFCNAKSVGLHAKCVGIIEITEDTCVHKECNNRWNIVGPLRLHIRQGCEAGGGGGVKQCGARALIDWGAWPGLGFIRSFVSIALAVCIRYKQHMSTVILIKPLSAI